MNSEANERSIFFEAVEQPSPAERAAYLDRACGGDAELRARIEALLDAHGEAGNFLRGPSPEDTPTINMPPITERPGTVIGPYKLLQQIGEGGMGTVYMAEQTRPVQRMVALKVIKPGMDSRQVIARFEAERQALAIMDHVNIARVFDGGTTDAGRPYFVMELVHGVPITRYCDDNQLTPRERLELFVPVCQAIQHAHQKGIIHRDIKPSNVMITLYDGQPVPKVIDFGVAKATEQKLTEQTLFTQYGTMVGTLEYMSPEQAEMSALGVDTRSDIYSLGVLLYELLTGSTPLSRQQMKEAAYAEILRLIKEEEPPKPSTRLSESGEALASISAQRHTEPAKLSKLMRGELDWIVMKTLEKDRNRRYETANGFAADVLRYLNDEPVMACPPSAAYRLRKLVRRNKAVIATGMLVVLAMVLGTVVATWQAIRATRAEAIAEERFEGEKQARQEADASRHQAEANFQMALDAVDQMLTEVGQESLSNVPHMEPVRRALLEKAMKFYRDFLEQKSTEPLLRYQTGRAYQRVCEICFLLGKGEEADAANRQALAILEQLETEFPHEPNYQYEVAESYRRRAHMLWNGSVKAASHGDNPDRAYAEAIHRHKGLAARFPDQPRYRHALAQSYESLAYYQRLTSRGEEGERTYHRAINLHQELVNSHPDSADYRHGLAQGYRALGVLQWVTGRSKAAETSLRQSISLGEQLVTDHPEAALYRQWLTNAQYHLGQVLRGDGRPAEAEEVLLAAKQLQEKLHADFPSIPEYRKDLSKTTFILAVLQQAAGRVEEAKKHYEQSVSLAPSSLRLNILAWMAISIPDVAPEIAAWAVATAQKAVELDSKNGAAWNTLGVAHYRAGNWKEAIGALETSRKLQRDLLESYDFFFLAMCHWKLGNEELARNFYEQAVQSMEKHHAQLKGNMYWVRELRLFRTEAAELLGIEKKKG